MKNQTSKMGIIDGTRLNSLHFENRGNQESKKFYDMASFIVFGNQLLFHPENSFSFEIHRPFKEPETLKFRQTNSDEWGAYWEEESEPSFVFEKMEEGLTYAHEYFRIF